MEIFTNEASTSQQNNKTRKRKIDPNNWKAKKPKIARNCGKAGISKEGKPILKKSMPVDGCNDHCRYQCAKKISIKIAKRFSMSFISLAIIPGSETISIN